MTAVTGTVSSTTGSSGWTNPNNIFTSNNVYAVTSTTIASSSATNYIYALGNGFSVPIDATIDGVEVLIEAKNQLSGTGFQCRATSSEIRLVYSGGDISSLPPTGVATTTWSSTSDATKTLGGSTVLWGATLTPAIINDSSFGVRARFFNLGSPQTFSIDRISITVYYNTDSSGVQSSQQLFMCEG